MINITPRILSKIIIGAKKFGRDTKKIEDARSNMMSKKSSVWTSRKCKSFDEIEQIFEDIRVVRPWKL